MSLVASKARLTAAGKELSNAWRDTKSHWRDAKALEFEGKYVNPLIDQLESAVVAIEKLDHLLAKVRQDCSPDA